MTLFKIWHSDGIKNVKCTVPSALSAARSAVYRRVKVLFKSKFILVFFFLSLNFQVFANLQDQEFVKSFIDHYDFRVEGRYTHEYHQFLLKKTADSFIELENRLREEGMEACGRIVIAGYEEEAVPSYYTDYKQMRINDEATSLGNAGWSLRLHNCFGLMSGFLFKDFNHLAICMHKNSSPALVHINPHKVEIFNDESGIFQQHAFGEAYDLLLDYKSILEKKVIENDPKLILQVLKYFWRDLYSNELKISSRQLAATQDILFSIEYADYLLRSSLPVLKYYTGPDITYPIEISIKQDKKATLNSQDFVPVLVSDLKPINNEATVYVFDSFVDGVGKSTMLGNVKNWIKFGEDIDQYRRVDNSSSQYAEIFQFSDNVFIADLPAQVSHFTYKPDGYVYVAAETELSLEELKRFRIFVRENKKNLIDDYVRLCEEVLSELGRSGPFSRFLDGKHGQQFIKNLILLKKQQNKIWIPFEKDGNHCLFNCLEPTQIRILVPLEKVSSYGLKSVEAEQMIFSGISLPASYDLFLNDFVKKLKKQNIKRVIFVDFLSMYPRSSRENIRINYLVQQLALLNPQHFNIENSFYKNFVSGSQLYAYFTYPRTFNKMVDAFQLEVALRLVLFRLIDGRMLKELEQIKLSELTFIIKDRIKSLKKDKSLMDNIVCGCSNKLAEEESGLKRLFGKSKEFINLWKFSFDLVHQFSETLQKFFMQGVISESLNRFLSEMDSPYFIDKLPGNYDGEVNGILHLENGCEVEVLYKFFPKCREATVLAPFFRKLRSCWYMIAANLLDSKVAFGENLVIENERYKISPLLLKVGKEDGQIYVIQRLLNPWEGEKPFVDHRKFNVCGKFKFGEFLGEPYSLNYESEGTNFGIFAFDCNVVTNRPFGMRSVISEIVRRYQEKNGTGKAITASLLYKELKNNKHWELNRKRMKREAAQNGEYKASEEKDVEGKIVPKLKEKKIFQGGPHQIAGAKVLVRMLATIEMILKDIDADIVVRKGNKKDFSAALKLFEQVTLPKYFGIFFSQPLFDNYDEVNPILPWDHFEE